MSKYSLYAVIFALIILIYSIPASFAQTSNELRIDPLMMVSLKECRNITQSLGDELFHGWDFQKTPVLFYRPNVQELLINYPYKPNGFSVYTGFNPLSNNTIYVRNDTTTISDDDQNTSTDIDSTRVLVVADPFSTMRNQLVDLLGRPKDFATRYLADWQFMPDPYYQLQVIMHEAFHVYQDKMAPDKNANEMIVSQYPLLDAENNALYVLEGNILKDALLSKESKSRIEFIKDFVAVRTFRQSRLDSNCVEYENLNEYKEGLAKYVEYKFMQKGEDIEPIREMYYHQGFNGYRGILSKRFRAEIDNMVNVVAVNDDRFGNKFGSGPLRFKLYDLGACEALLLDDVMPHWKDRIFEPNIYLADLLKEPLRLTANELQQYLDRSKKEYKYDEAYRNKIEFEKEGKRKIEEKVSSIIKTEQTLVKISFAGIGQQARVGRYTPFGVTQISKQSTMYELVPILILFKKGIALDFKQTIPVIVDQDRQEVVFSIATPPSKFPADSKNTIDVDEFSLTSATDIHSEGNTVYIRLK